MVAVNYDWDEIEDNVDEEYDDTGTTVADYTHEPYLYGDLISQHRSGQSRFYCFDGQGSTLAITDSQGFITDTYSYTAFGEVTERTGASVNLFQYVGQAGYFRGDNTGRYDARHRTMLPSPARWLSIDPLFLLSTVLLPYAYADNQPGFTDPSGLAKHHWFPRIGTKGYDYARKICPGFDIDKYTTPLTNSHRGMPHHWLHNAFGGIGYVPIAEALYIHFAAQQPPNCCHFLFAMSALMGQAWAALRDRFPGDPTISDPVPPLQPWKGVPIDTTADLAVEIARRCGNTDAATRARNCGVEYNNCVLLADHAYRQCRAKAQRFCRTQYMFAIANCSSSQRACVEVKFSQTAGEVVAAHPEIVILTVCGIAVIIIIVQPELAPIIVPALPAAGSCCGRPVFAF